MFDLGAVVAHIKADTSQFQQGIKTAKAGVDDFKEGTIDLGANLRNLAIATTAVGATLAAGIGVFLKSSADDAREFNRQMTTLGIIAERFGVSADKAKQQAQALGKELMIGTGAAAESLQNLLKSGLNIDQASELLRRFTNEAITGKSKSIDLATAVQNLSFAYGTENSALGNLSGISENFSDIIEKGKQSLIKKGMSVKDITNDMAKYEGMIQLTNLTLGSADKITDEGTRKQAEFTQKMQEFRIAIGQAVLPILNALVALLVDGVLPIMARLEPVIVSLINAVQTNFPMFQQMVLTTFGQVVAFINDPLIPAIQNLARFWNENLSWVSLQTNLIFNVIKGIIQVALGVIYGIVTVILNLIAGDWTGAWEAVKKSTGMIFDGLKSIFGGFIDFVKGWGDVLYNKIKEPFDKAWATIQDTMAKVKDALDLTKRHSPSVVDIVEHGVDKVNRALSEIMINGNIAPAPMVASSIMGGPSSVGATNITIDLSGAMISDEQGAQRIGEIVGDNIIRRLQANVRF